MDGPVVTAARRAFDTGDLDVVLPYVPAGAEAEVSTVFDAVRRVRDRGEDARAVAERLFFETVVRLHRAGEGAPFTGLKPAGTPVGPVIPLAEEALETGSPEPVAGFLTGALREQLAHRLDEVTRLAATRGRSVSDGRRYVSAMLGFEVYCHHLYQAMRAPAHDGHGARETHGSKEL